MTDIVGLSHLAADTYEEVRVGSPGYSEVTGSFSLNEGSGFQANTYFNSSRNELVISYAGTDPFGGGDLDDDWALFQGGPPEQASEALGYANQQITNFSNENPSNTNFSVVYTGHSLGGYLAQHVHLTNGNGSAVVFNSPGVNSGTVRNGDPDIVYVFSNPSEWGAASAIHTLGDYVGDKYYFVMDASGHGIREIRDAVGPGASVVLSPDDLVNFWAEQIKSGQLRAIDLLGKNNAGVPNGLAYEAISISTESCFGPEVPIDMWPLDPEFAPDPNNPFKQYDQDAVRAKIWKKPIELIRVGDYVVSHDNNGNMVPGFVPRTLQNDAKILLNFHGTRVTPGHVYYRPDSKNSYKYETLIDVLRDDGMIESCDGVKLRAATNASVGGPLDGFVMAITGTCNADGTVTHKNQGRIRLGTRFLVGTGKERKSFAVADLIEHGGGIVGDDELIRVGDGPGMPFHWDFGDTLPKPEDFVLACSDTSLEEIYQAAEWESQGPRLAAPMVLDRGPVQPLTGAALSAMPRNEPLVFVNHGNE